MVASSGYVERDNNVIWEVSKVAVLQSHDFAGEAIGKVCPARVIYLAEDKVMRCGEQEARWDVVARSPGVRLTFSSEFTRATTNHAPRQALQTQAPRGTPEAREPYTRCRIEFRCPDAQFFGQKPRRPDTSFVGRDGAQPAPGRAKQNDVFDFQRINDDK